MAMSQHVLPLLAKDKRDSIVRIVVRCKGRTTVGTGFFIDKNRIVTCAHVLLDVGNVQEVLDQHPEKKPEEAVRARLEKLETLSVERADGSHVKLQKHCDIDPAFDVALLHTIAHSGEPLNVSSKKIGIGEDICMLGFPEAIHTDQTRFPYTANKGYVMSYPIVKIGGYKKRCMMQVFCSSLGGASGSPIFSAEGEVIGMLNGQMQWGADNFVFMEKDEKNADTFKKDFLYVPLPIGFATTGAILLSRLTKAKRFLFKKVVS